MSTATSDRTIVTLVIVLLGALLVVPLLFMGFAGGPMMGGGWGHGMWGDGGTAPGWAIVAGLVVRVLFLGALVAVGYLVYRSVARRTDGRDRAMEELRLAYARGDLSEEEYESRRDRLQREG